MKSYSCNSCLNKVSNFSESKFFPEVWWLQWCELTNTLQSLAVNHSLQIKGKACECSYVCSSQLYFWRRPLNFGIYSALHIWSLDKWRLDIRSALSGFFTLFTDLDAPSKHRRLLCSVKAGLYVDANVFSFNWYPLHQQNFLKAAVLYGWVPWEIQFAEQVGKPCFCGKDQEKWVFPNLCTPRWLKVFEEYEEECCSNTFFFFLFFPFLLFHYLVIN